MCEHCHKEHCHKVGGICGAEIRAEIIYIYNKGRDAFITARVDEGVPEAIAAEDIGAHEAGIAAVTEGLTVVL